MAPVGAAQVRESSCDPSLERRLVVSSLCFIKCNVYRYAAVEPSFNVMGLVLSGINLTLSAMQVGLALLSPRYFAVKTPML